MRIVHVIDSDGVYGAEVMLLNLMSEQKRLGLSPVLLSLEADENGGADLRKEAASRGLHTERLRLSRGFKAESCRALMDAACGCGAQIIHSHGYKGNILLGLPQKKKRSVPVVSTIHGWTSVSVFSKIYFYVLLDKFCLKRIDAVIHVNSTAERLGMANEFTVENGIPELAFDIEKARQDKAINGFISGSPLVIGAVSRLSEEKGLIHLLKALRVLKDGKAAFKAVILGEGPLKSELSDSARELDITGELLFAGYRENAFNYLKLFDVFVLPSLTEGLPMTILEAMQSGTPIVATRIGGVPHVLGDGKYGELVEPADPGAIAEAVLKIGGDRPRYSGMAQRARQRALDDFSSRKMAGEYQKIYAKVMAGWRP